MTNKLRVIKPYHVLEVGDILTLTKKGDAYQTVYNDEYNNDNNDNIWFDYSSVFTVSVEHAKDLVKAGYLEEVPENEEKPFVNVFDEIDKLIESYKKDLSNIEEDFKDKPACLKVEKTTVLNNLLKVLNHLKDLRK